MKRMLVLVMLVVSALFVASCSKSQPFNCATCGKSVTKVGMAMGQDSSGNVGVAGIEGTCPDGHTTVVRARECSKTSDGHYVFKK